MKTSSVLWLAAGVGAVWYFGSIARAADTIQIIFKGVSFSGLTNLKITLTVQNVSNASITVNSMTGTIAVNGNQLGNISDFNMITINPNSQTDVVVDLGIGLFSLPAIVQNIISNPTQPYNVTIDGNANVNGLILPFHLNNQFSL